MKTIFDITEYGAVSDGKTDCTKAIQNALDAASSCQGKVLIKDLGFGELFPASDMNYKGELQWQQ